MALLVNFQAILIQLLVFLELQALHRLYLRRAIRHPRLDLAQIALRPVQYRIIERLQILNLALNLVVHFRRAFRVLNTRERILPDFHLRQADSVHSCEYLLYTFPLLVHELHAIFMSGLQLRDAHE